MLDWVCFGIRFFFELLTLLKTNPYFQLNLQIIHIQEHYRNQCFHTNHFQNANHFSCAWYRLIFFSDECTKSLVFNRRFCDIMSAKTQKCHTCRIIMQVLSNYANEHYECEQTSYGSITPLSNQTQRNKKPHSLSHHIWLNLFHFDLDIDVIFRIQLKVKSHQPAISKWAALRKCHGSRGFADFAAMSFSAR